MILLGLGNPGDEYAGTRHNAGYDLIEAARRKWGGASWKEQPNGQESRIRLGGRLHPLVRPTTFMNRSGLAAEAALRSEGASPGDLLVLLDDIDLPLGKIRIRPEGGAGGHRGLQSVLETLGTTGVARLRVGVGRPEGARDVSAHVLEVFDEQERERFAQVVQLCLNALGLALTRGLAAAMNRCNGLPPPWEAAAAGRRAGRVLAGGLDKPPADGAK